MPVVLTIHGACPLPLRYAILRNEGVHVVAHIVVAEVVGRVVDVLLVGLIEAVGPDGASGRLLRPGGHGKGAPKGRVNGRPRLCNELQAVRRQHVRPIAA